MTDTTIIKHLDTLYARRTDDAASVRESVRLIKDQLARSEHDAAIDAYELLWRLSRAHFFIGQQIADDVGEGDRRSRATNEARDQHRAGAGAGSRAAQLAPSRVEGHLWAGINLALRAAHEPKIVALFSALRARTRLRHAATIDAAHHGAAPLRVLARLESNLPRVFGGGITRARRGYEDALKLAPTNPVTRIYFAELLMSISDENAARAHLDAIRDSVVDPWWAYEAERDRRRASELLRQLDR